MKKLITIFMAFTMSLSLTANWTPVPKEQAEYNAILWHIAGIKERFCSMGSNSSSSGVLHSQIFQLLKRIGTPIAYKILQEMVANKELPAHYLSMA